MRMTPRRLLDLSVSIFKAAGCHAPEAECVGEHLVEANLAGHDSHGVIRIPYYVDWIDQGKVVPNQTPVTILETDTIAVIDAQLGFGQVMGRRAMQVGLEKCRRQGVAITSLRNAAHLGRIGHWAEMAACEQMVSLHFVNTNGLGMLVAPVGGIERRLSANPVAAGIPVPDRPPIIFDISTSAVAEGKIKVARNRQVPLPDGMLIDSNGRPTNDAEAFYSDPPGAILPFGGHKGYGLGIVAEILAGALTGTGCSRPGQDRLEQGMLTILIDPQRLDVGDSFGPEVVRFIDFVKSARKESAESVIRMPGDPEQERRRERADGIELDETTWGQLCAVAERLGVSTAD